MMKIPLKIRPEKTAPRPEPKPEERLVKGRALKPIWLISLVIILILAASGLVMFVKARPFSPFQEFVSADAIGVIYFNQARLAQNLEILAQRHFGWEPFISVAAQVKELAAKNQFELQVVAGLFEDDMALVLLPAPESSAKNAGQPGWLFLARAKSSSEIASVLDRAAEQLKRNYNLTIENYRQVKITEVKALSHDQAGIFYAQDQSYFLASNNLNAVKTGIDKIIGR